jgi:hypothetical protein
VKIEIAPEDLIFEYTNQLLLGVREPVLKFEKYLDRMPSRIEYSEEFAEKWSLLVEVTVRRFLINTFKFRPFIYDKNGQIARYCASDKEFWEEVDLSFSFRSADRIWELIMLAISKEDPVYIMAKPGDALFLSLINNVFGEYHFNWLIKNNANWLIIAAFIAHSPVTLDRVPWVPLLLKPETVPLQIRDLLIEKVKACMVLINHIVREVISTGTFSVENNFEPFEELSFETGAINFGRRVSVPVGQLQNLNSPISKHFELGRELISAINKAIDYWANDGAICIDDDRHIQGYSKSCGLTDEIHAFENMLSEYNEQKSLEEAVHESLIQGQPTH